ncbi:MAG: coniferyl aldehyde dehydrogenase [Colwellia sp.]|nr:coniferyl aldehyde dehydrogenase [Colwellia sp.]
MNLIQTINDVNECFESQKNNFLSAPYRSYDERISDLKKLKKLLIDNQKAFIEALDKDFGGRSADDTRIGDIITTISGLNYTIKNLKKWMKPEKRKVDLLFQPAKASILFQPLGVVGVVVPWNYPVFLSLGPLSTALAAGNRVMLKMSELTPETAKLLADILQQNFSKKQVAIVGGEVDIATAFTSLAFDHLFFTGSTNVGKIVMKAAANNLVPVTLELGGKSPAIIDDEIDIKLAVSRFILGKVLNSGQTCVAPDYIFCPEGKEAELVEELRTVYSKMFPKVTGNKDCTSIINDVQFKRLNGLLDDARSHGAKITPLIIEPVDETQRKMPLTVLTNVNDSMKVMQQEIFGPIIPIFTYKNTADAIQYINKNDRPLALYIYSFNKDFQQEILLNTHAGGVCINEATFHVANDDLPFGGIGASGMGQYHGKEGFRTFSHGKSILEKGKVSFAHLLFPPFGGIIHKLVYKLFIR